MRVAVPATDGSFVGREVVTGVNVATDPDLRALCLSGTLHGEGPGALAIPYVFHDPDAECFLLVVPTPLRHRLREERAALLERLAAENATFVPAYVAEVETVVGALGLLRALGGGGDARASELEVELLADEPSVDGEEALLESVELLADDADPATSPAGADADAGSDAGPGAAEATDEGAPSPH